MALQYKTILVVEDNPITRKMMRFLLEKEDYFVVEAVNGKEAIEKLNQHPPALILQDMLLPDINGFELVKKIRAHPHGQDSHVIACSGLRDELSKEEKSSHGFSEWVEKPVEPQHLIGLVKAYCHTPNGASQPQVSPKILVIDDNAMMRQLLSVQLRQEGYQVVAKEGAEEALTWLQEHIPDAIVSDVLMPGIDGFQLCRQLRADTRLLDTPIVLLSAHYVEPEDKQLAEHAGATAYISRSSNSEELLRWLRSLWQEAIISSPVTHQTSAVYTSSITGQPDHHMNAMQPVDEDDGFHWNTSSSPELPESPWEEIYYERVRQQLDRQSQLNIELAQESSLLAAQLSVLAGASITLANTLDFKQMCHDLLSRYLDSSGFSVGAIFLRHHVNSFNLQVSLGNYLVSQLQEQELQYCYQLFEQVLKRGDLYSLQLDKTSSPIERKLLQRLQICSLEIFPLSWHTHLFGVLFVGTKYPSISQKGRIEFVRAIGGQLGLVLMLGQTLSQLSLSEQRFRSSAEAAVEGILIADEQHKIVYHNPAIERLFGYDKNELARHKVTSLLPTYRKQLGTWKGEGLGRDSRSFPISVSTTVFTTDLERQYTTHLIQDLTEQKRFEFLLAQRSGYDSLTDLYNRQRFREELARRLERTNQHNIKMSLVLVDLYRLKIINENFGQQAGDHVLREIAGLLIRECPESAVLARLGGDEFGFFFTYNTEEECQHAIQTVMQALNQLSIEHEDKTLVCKACIGGALYPAHGTQAEQLFSCAELALLQAKTIGPSNLCIYDAEAPWAQELTGSLYWVHEIYNALREDRFVLHYQPIQALHDGSIASYEALIRMKTREGKLLYPGDFLGAAEKFGLMGDIDQWVVKQTIQLIADQHSQGRHISIEANLSAQSLSSTKLLQEIQEALQTSNIDPSLLTLEITETAAITNLPEAQQFITTMKQFGCRFALDDFGVGFTSFYQLKHLPVDYLKIDGSFIRDITRDKTDQHLVKAMVEVARGLGKQTIAEFVGDQHTVELLSQYGVDFAQGYFIGKPGPDWLVDA